MKMKYQKMINMILLMTLCIGAVLAGILTPHSRYDDGASDTFDTMKTVSEDNLDSEEGDSVVLASTLTSPTPSPAPTPLKVYPLEEKDYPKPINKLIDTFYKAKISCDIDQLKNISTNPEAVIDQDSLKKLIDGIEEYLNIKCYVKRTYIKDFYIVWVYYDIKFIGLNTYAPSLSKVYVKCDSDGKFKIYDGEIEDELKSYLKERSNDADVLELKEHTEALAKKAKEEDEDLSEFWNILDGKN